VYDITSLRTKLRKVAAPVQKTKIKGRGPSVEVVTRHPSIRKT
jgi:hypothetical protein